MDKHLEMHRVLDGPGLLPRPATGQEPSIPAILWSCLGRPPADAAVRCAVGYSAASISALPSEILTRLVGAIFLSSPEKGHVLW